MVLQLEVKLAQRYQVPDIQARIHVRGASSEALASQPPLIQFSEIKSIVCYLVIISLHTILKIDSAIDERLVVADFPLDAKRPGMLPIDVGETEL